MILGKYNSAMMIAFPLIKAGSNNFAINTDYTYAAGDIKIVIDNGAAANSTNSPTYVATGNGGGIWTLNLTAAEMAGKMIIVTIVDATTKAVEDQAIIIQTYGDGNGILELRDWADALLKRDWTAITGEAARSVLNALRSLRNKWSISGLTLTVTKEDDTTTAYTSTLTANGTNQVTSSDPS
jgi:flagellar capping protein FliD